jgi:hypothetical protein
MNCFICETSPADTTFGVGLTKVTQNGAMKHYQHANVKVPVCEHCKTRELAAVRQGAKISLIAWAVLTAIGAIFGGWDGAGFGFGLGFFITLGANAIKKPSKLATHQECRALQAEGYRVTYP